LINKIEMQPKDDISYSHLLTIGGTYLVPLFYKYMAELMETGHCTLDTCEQVTNTTQGIVAEIDTKIVGFGVFEHLEGEKTMFDFFTYVDPNYRQRGIFTEIQNGLLKYAKENKIEYIHSYISIKNEVSIIAHKKMGYNLVISKSMPEFYEYIHSV
jgi:RimJ/RimL family protein N-acetyltransferase